MTDFEPIEGTNGGVLKKILVEGKGDAKPTAGDKVQVHYTGTLTADGSKFDSSRDRDGNFEFQLGVGQVIKAWDVGVATMKQGETCILRCTAEFGYGERGSPPKIPANAGLDFEVELLDWAEGSKEPWQMSIQEKMENGEKKRLEGNDKFKSGDFHGAVRAYRAGLIPLQDMYEEAGEETGERQTEDRETGKELTVKLALNLAMARLKTDGEMFSAVKECSLALSLSPDNTKALFRRAQANMRRGELAPAKTDLEHVLSVDAENSEAANELKKVEVAMAKAKKAEKAMYSKMFG
eukprot:CAMPEP_0196728276 /NCGR_PEP_ID=MMETSP1091-20130531/8991_1 /TAXON_ID=302021 /ORGANISM="Rhodomonas sp., Strain CCMP768" /LENGTH=293 /DNA_ID=CAMNT_0042070995 /DNA_START=14 /DNA_END=895 /DNA_ORIENTATION=-